MNKNIFLFYEDDFFNKYSKLFRIPILIWILNVCFPPKVLLYLKTYIFVLNIQYLIIFNFDN